MASSTRRRWVSSVSCAVMVAACARTGEEGQPATPESASAARGAKSEPLAPRTSKDEDAARARAPRRPPRDAETITSDVDGLERLLAGSAPSAGDRPQLIRRIAERYLELEAALEQRKSPEAARDAKKARQKAIERYEQIVKEHPTYGAMDEVLYDLARAHEDAGELEPARRQYANLVERFPSSPLVPRALYGLGVILREQGRSHPAKKKLAEEAFEKAARSSKPDDPVHRLAVAENGGVEPSAIVQTPAPVAAPASASPSPSPSPSPSASAAPAPPQSAKLGVDGTYVAEGGNYRLEAKFETGKIIVTEPNKVSVYEQQGESRVHRYVDRALDTEYLLEIAPDGKTLFAFKPKTPNNRTKLTLLGPAPTGECKAKEIPVQNDAALNPNKERLFGTHERSTVDVTGTYLTDGGHPKIVLDQHGVGVFEMHGAPKDEYVYKVSWWLQVNCDGTPISTDHPAARLYWIVIDFGDRPFQGLRYKRYGVQVRTDRMVILDRVKPR